MDYDVLILGGGIIGCSIAYELSKYSLNIALIEKEYDIANEVANINSVIVYDGVESTNTLMAKLEILGNSMFDEITKKFNVPFKKCGSFIIAQNYKQEKKIEEIYERAIKRGIKDIEIVDGTYIYKNEPNLNIPVIKALYSKNTGVVSPYDLAISYGEVAFDNGVNFKLEEEVLDIQKISRGYKIVTNKNKFTCRTVINTTPGVDYKNEKEKKYSKKSIMNSIMISKNFDKDMQKVVITMNEKEEVLGIINSTQGNNIITAESSRSYDFQKMRETLGGLVQGIEEKDVNRFFHYKYNKEPIIIDDSLIDKGYIKVSGKHYAEVTMTPSIASMVCETIVGNLNAN